jgi:hypothetical protein
MDKHMMNPTTVRQAASNTHLAQYSKELSARADWLELRASLLLIPDTNSESAAPSALLGPLLPQTLLLSPLAAAAAAALGPPSLPQTLQTSLLNRARTNRIRKAPTPPDAGVVTKVSKKAKANANVTVVKRSKK